MSSLGSTAWRMLGWWLAPRQRADEANGVRLRFMVMGWLCMFLVNVVEALLKVASAGVVAPALGTAAAAVALLFANRRQVVPFSWLVHLSLVIALMRFALPVALSGQPTASAMMWVVVLPVVASIAIGLRAALSWLVIAVGCLCLVTMSVSHERSSLSELLQVASAALGLGVAFFVLDREHHRSNDRFQRAIAARELVLTKLSHDAKTPLHQLINALDSQAAEGTVTPHVESALQAAGQLTIVLHEVFRQARESSTAEPQPPPQVFTLKASVTARVLVVDDNPINLRMAVSMLERLHCQVETAPGGVEAVEAVSRGGFDLVVMDCHMPDVDGFEATRRIRAASALIRDVPIVALTASSDPEDANRARDAGMNAFLEKPLRQKDIERLLAPSAQKRAA